VAVNVCELPSATLALPGETIKAAGEGVGVGDGTGAGVGVGVGVDDAPDPVALLVFAPPMLPQAVIPNAQDIAIIPASTVELNLDR
jgi:hypothetical protein